MISTTSIAAQPFGADGPTLRFVAHRGDSIGIFTASGSFTTSGDVDRDGISYGIDINGVEYVLRVNLEREDGAWTAAYASIDRRHSLKINDVTDAARRKLHDLTVPALIAFVETDERVQELLAYAERIHRYRELEGAHQQVERAKAALVEAEENLRQCQERAAQPV